MIVESRSSHFLEQDQFELHDIETYKKGSETAYQFQFVQL